MCLDLDLEYPDMQTGIDDGPLLPKHVIDGWQKDKIISLRSEGKSFRAIAKEIGISHEAVRDKLNRLGMK